ncbi:MAG TPA: hypothetical protein VGV10_01160 [Thermoleophilaceae bacterium]|nr:hypothetical protein [Thermoleophilaceae bacterium]
MPAGRTTSLLLAIALAGGGCGGDSDESAERPRTADTRPGERTAPRRDTRTDTTAPEAGDTLTAAQYRRNLNRLCREDQAAADRLGGISTPESIEPYLRRAIRYARKREPLYERLRPPPSLRASHRDSIRLNDRAESTFTELLGRIERGGDPVEEFRKAAPALGRVLNDGNRLARRMGAKDCIVDAPSPGAQSPQNPS